MAGSKTPHEISFGQELRVTPGHRKTAGACRYIRRGLQPTRRISTYLRELAHTQTTHAPHRPWRAHLPRPGRRWQVCTGHVLIHVLRYELLRLILHRLGQHTTERVLTPPAEYGHPLTDPLGSDCLICASPLSPSGAVTHGLAVRWRFPGGATILPGLATGCPLGLEPMTGPWPGGCSP